ncbi:UNVERIFIED_CONTAM: hypothetical protein GTU68_022570, partial [Idotea baltica]|nr:hypothetical protein [Idotea baltica]
RYFLINSGNANACTGDLGLHDARQSCASVAEIGAVQSQQVLPFSTGVIGEPMNMDALQQAIPTCFSSLDETGWRSGAEGITTTDTFPKGVTRTISLSGATVTINGIAKGAGMIRPDMATMLSYVVSDAVISKEALDEACRIAVGKSFNRITVDGDTSTNDAAMLASTQRAGNDLIEDLESEDGKRFAQAVIDVFESLAKLLTVSVEGASSEKDALDVAYTVAQSPLVKTALFASDPNWGRIVMAIGRSGVSELDACAVKVWLSGVLVVENGCVAEDYTEEKGQSVLSQEEIVLKIDLGMGNVSESVWTCDFSHEYVSINADYRS